MNDPEGQTTKLVNPPEIITHEELNKEIDEILDMPHPKDHYEYYINKKYGYHNNLIKICTIMGIIGAIICIICVFLPNKATYNIDGDWHYNNLITAYPNWIGWVVLGLSIICLVIFILVKFDFGIIKLILASSILFFNRYSNTWRAKSYFRSMAYGYYIMYIGVSIIIISSVIAFIVSLINVDKQKELARY